MMQGPSATLMGPRLVGVGNANVAGSAHPGMMVAAGPHGGSIGAGWMRMGPWVGLVVPDMVGVANMVLPRSISM